MNVDALMDLSSEHLPLHTRFRLIQNFYTFPHSFYILTTTVFDILFLLIDQKFQQKKEKVYVFYTKHFTPPNTLLLSRFSCNKS